MRFRCSKFSFIRWQGHLPCRRLLIICKYSRKQCNVNLPFCFCSIVQNDLTVLQYVVWLRSTEWLKDDLNQTDTSHSSFVFEMVPSHSLPQPCGAESL